MSSPPAAVVVKNRWLGFLIWQFAASAAVLLPSAAVLRRAPSFPLVLLSLLSFHLSLLLLFLALFLLLSPHPHPAATSLELAAAALKFFFRSLVYGFDCPSLPSEARIRARRSFASLLFLAICGASGLLSACGGPELLDGRKLVGFGLTGLVLGLVYGVHFLYWRRWILEFPIIQRPLFYRFKMEVLSSLKQAVKLSAVSFISSMALMPFLPDHLKIRSTWWDFIVQQFFFYIWIFFVSFCWELSLHLLQVVHTRRFNFATLQGSAAVETNPSEPLLDALEQSPPRSLMQYLAYLDLCMVAESNSEPWRRAAFFEESGGTYRRIMSACLRPLEQLTSRLAEGLEGFSVDKPDLSQQLNSPLDACVDSMLREAFNDVQICTWSARTVAALTAHSKNKDRYGVAQLTGCNKAVVSTLLSCLLAVETCMGKKNNPPPMQLASIRWATSASAAVKKRPLLGGALHGKAYAMADVLRTSIYQIVSVFLADMEANAKVSALDKNWISDGKPLFGTSGALVQKLALFLHFRAT